jgi:hypothetical protein
MNQAIWEPLGIGVPKELEQVWIDEGGKAESEGGHLSSVRGMFEELNQTRLVHSNALECPLVQPGAANRGLDLVELPEVGMTDYYNPDLSAVLAPQSFVVSAADAK